MKKIVIFLVLVSSVFFGFSQQRSGSAPRSSTPSTSVRVTSPSVTNRSSISRPSGSFSTPSSGSYRATTPSQSVNRSYTPQQSYKPTYTQKPNSNVITNRPSTNSGSYKQSPVKIVPSTPRVNSQTIPPRVSPQPRSENRSVARPMEVQKTPSVNGGEKTPPPHVGGGHPNHHNDGINAHAYRTPPPPPVHHHGDRYPHHHGFIGHHPYHHHIYHPYYHRNIYLHRIYWNPYVPVVVIDGFWLYTHSYYFIDYNVRTTYVRSYNTATVEMVDYVVDDYYTYCIQKVGWDRYFRVFDNNNRLIAQQLINKKYDKLIYDEVSEGVWCISDRDNNNLFFIVDGNEHLICYSE